MFKKIVIENVVRYFHSDQWNRLEEILERGREVRHLHIYAESALHPHDMAKIVQGYFAKKGFTLQRKIGFLGHGKGVTNVYYIHPRIDMAHFELFLHYNPDIVIEPADASKTRGGENLEFWDDQFMEKYYLQFSFHNPTKEEEKIIANYFKSAHWEQSYDFMTDNGIHCHVPVKTSIYPEILLDIGKKVIEEKGWKVSKADSVVYSMKGYDQGKITYLLSSPEIVLELDWEFDSSAIIEPRNQSLILTMTEDTFLKSMQGVQYYRLGNNEIQQIIDLI